MPKKPLLGVDGTLGVLGGVGLVGSELLTLGLFPPPQSTVVRTAAPPNASRKMVTANKHFFALNTIVPSMKTGREPLTLSLIDTVKRDKVAVDL
jgi:hypothetical protein